MSVYREVLCGAVEIMVDGDPVELATATVRPAEADRPAPVNAFTLSKSDAVKVTKESRTWAQSPEVVQDLWRPPLHGAPGMEPGRRLRR